MSGILHTRELVCGYPGTPEPVLAGLSLTVHPGRLVCVIGSNGAGKTTLVRALAGLLKPRCGQVLMGDELLHDVDTRDRAREISVVLTRLPVPGYLSVQSFVEIGRHPYTGTLGALRDTDRDAVTSAMEQVGILHLRHRWMSAISDGERQRAAIARALAQAARLMILDEPTAFLDVEARALVMTLLRRVAHETGRGVIATTHDIELALRIADEIWMITPEGDLLTGAPEDLVLGGAMEQVFPEHVLRFDPKSGGFRLPRPAGPVVTVIGTGVLALWTMHALERAGLQPIGKVTTESGAAEAAATAAAPETPASGPGNELAAIVPTSLGSPWQLHHRGEIWDCPTLGTLVEQCRSLETGSHDQFTHV